MRAVQSFVLELLKEHEVYVGFVYDDAYYPPRRAFPGDVAKGCFTAGFGHTGEEVKPGMAVTRALADAWLLADATNAAFKLEGKVGREVIDELTDNQYGALIMFVFNLGVGSKRKKEWTIWGRLRRKEFEQIPLELAKFVNDKRPDGTTVKLAGLVKRRNAEIELWSKDEPGSHEINLPSSVTRNNETPPTPSDPVPPSQSKSMIAGVVGAATAAPVMINQVTTAITPYAKQSEYVEQALGILATIAAVCVAVTLIYMYIQKRKARN